MSRESGARDTGGARARIVWIALIMLVAMGPHAAASASQAVRARSADQAIDTPADCGCEGLELAEIHLLQGKLTKVRANVGPNV